MFGGLSSAGGVRRRTSSSDEESSARHRPDPSRVKRCLFGRTNPQENKEFCDRELKRHKEEACSRWNFDFDSGRPLQGRLDWEEVAQDQIPSAYNLSRLPYLATHQENRPRDATGSSRGSPGSDPPIARGGQGSDPQSSRSSLLQDKLEGSQEDLRTPEAQPKAEAVNPDSRLSPPSDKLYSLADRLASTDGTHSVHSSGCSNTYSLSTADLMRHPHQSVVDLSRPHPDQSATDLSQRHPDKSATDLSHRHKDQSAADLSGRDQSAAYQGETTTFYVADRLPDRKLQNAYATNDLRSVRAVYADGDPGLSDAPRGARPKTKDTKITDFGNFRSRKTTRSKSQSKMSSLKRLVKLDGGKAARSPSLKGVRGPTRPPSSSVAGPSRPTEEAHSD